MENSPLLLAVSFTQQLDPLAGLVSASAFWSTVVAALPVIVLFWLLVVSRWSAPLAGAGATFVAGILAYFVYGTPLVVVSMAFISTPINLTPYFFQTPALSQSMAKLRAV